MDLKERIQELCKQAGISMNQLEQELNFGKGYISKLGKSVPNVNKIQLIANRFNVTVDYLMTGETPEEKKDVTLTRRDERDIEKILDQTREQLLSQEGLMFDGQPASPEAVESILSAMQVGMELAKKKNKEKYTPKKIQKGLICLWI